MNNMESHFSVGEEITISFGGVSTECTILDIQHGNGFTTYVVKDAYSGEVHTVTFGSLEATGGGDDGSA